MDVETATREQLVELIAEQQALIAQLQATIEQLQARVAELEQRLGQGKHRGMPGHKAQGADPSQPKAPRKKRPQGFARVRAGTPTEQVVHALDTCPQCGTHLVGGSVKRTREVIEVEPSPVRIIEHVYVERRCPQCGRRCVPKAELQGEVVGEQRLGVGLVSLIATVREEGRWPIGMIQRYLDVVHGLHLSIGAIVGALHRVAAWGKPELEQIRERVRASPVAQLDETGWRQQGHNGYVWTYSTPSERSFAYGGRNKEMVDQGLGAEFSGVVVCDFYAGYDHYAGLKQRCWVHLCRDIHELKELWPHDESVQEWAKAVHDLYLEAKGFASPKDRERARAKVRFERRLLSLCAPYAKEPAAAQRKLCARITRYIEELFVFVAYPEVPSENNGAERSLRHLVISRKISGATRSEQGTATKMTLSSLFGTWRTQGLNPLATCRQMLISPQV